MKFGLSKQTSQITPTFTWYESDQQQQQHKHKERTFRNSESQVLILKPEKIA